MLNTIYAVSMFAFVVCASISAQAAQFKNKYQIQSVETREITTSDVQVNQVRTLANPFDYVNKKLSQADAQCEQAEFSGAGAKTLNLSAADIGQIIKIGKDVWKVIEDNKPVVDVKVDTIAVVPVQAKCWRWLTGWQAPVSRTFQTVFKNGFGAKVVDFTYKIIYIAGGNYKGQGHYLARVALVPSNLRVLWGYKFNASVSVPSVLNYGTVLDPVAAVEMEMQYSVDTVLAHDSSTVNFFVKGTGEAEAL